jgi:hypothetical protein
MPLSQLKWSKANMTTTADGTSFTNGADASAFGGATPVAAGEHTYDYAYGLDVNYLNKTGSFATTATYTVTQG